MSQVAAACGTRHSCTARVSQVAAARPLLHTQLLHCPPVPARPARRKPLQRGLSIASRLRSTAQASQVASARHTCRCCKAHTYSLTIQRQLIVFTSCPAHLTQPLRKRHIVLEQRPLQSPDTLCRGPPRFRSVPWSSWPGRAGYEPFSPGRGAVLAQRDRRWAGPASS
jgi:hypothetical protein